MASTSMQLRGLGLSCKPSTGIRDVSCGQASVAKSSSRVEHGYVVLESSEFWRGNQSTKANRIVSGRRRGRSLTSKAVVKSFDASNVSVEEQELSRDGEQDQRDIAEILRGSYHVRHFASVNHTFLFHFATLPREVKWQYGNNNCWRGNRSCPSRRYTILLSQKIRGTARDVGYSGLLLEPVSYIGSQSAPAVETKNKALRPAGVDEEERLLNALVAKARIRETSHRNGCTAQEGKRGKEGEEENSAGVKQADEFQRSIEEGAYERIETESRNQGKQAWRLYVEGLRSEDERQVPCVESGSGNARELEETILFLESIGVDATKLLVYPFVVNCSLQKSKKIIRTLQTAGLKVSDLGRILTMSPQIFSLSVEGDLRPKMKFLLKEVGLANQDLRKVIRRCPRLLVVSIDEQLRPTMQFLRKIGFTGMASVVSNNPSLLTFSIRKKLIPKLEFLQSLGLSYEDACTMVVRFPAIFNYGIEQNLRPKYEYLVKVMGRSLDDLIVFPQYFGYSLDYRIRSRHEFLVERNLSLSLPNLLKLSNQEFSERFKDVQVKAGKKQKLATVAESQVPADRRREIPVPSLR